MTSSKAQRDTSDSLATPRSKQLQRLTVEAAKYLGSETEESIPSKTVRRQAAANGYTDTEIDALLRAGDCFDAEYVPIPDQGNLLGYLWDQRTDSVGDTSESTATNILEERPATRSDTVKPEPLDPSEKDYHRHHEPIADAPSKVEDERYLQYGKPITAFEAAISYIKRRHGENTSARKHGYKKTRQWRANRRYAKGKKMDRQLLDEYDNPTTALLSLRVSPGEKSRLTLLAGMKEAINEAIEQIGYRLQWSPNAPFSADEWEYFAVIAGTRDRATPHLHVFVYCNGDVDRALFEPVVEKFVEKCPYAPNDMRGNEVDDGPIRIRGQGSDTIPRMDEAPSESAGATYVLGQLPHLENVDEMALDELLHSSTVDAWQSHAFRRSNYTVWDDEEEPAQDEISDVEPTLSPDSLSDLV